MKPFNIILQIVTLFLLCNFDKTESDSNRVYMQISKVLFLVEPDGKYTWKQALAECKKDHFNLIQPKGDYDYARLKGAITYHFKNYSNFWTSTTICHQLGLSEEEHDLQKCNKFDNSSSLKFLPDDCDNQFGFICEKPLLQNYSTFNANNIGYFVQPNREFTCKEAYNHCEKQKMSLLMLKDHDNNKLLKDYLFFNYGSSVNFWFSYNNESYSNCSTLTTGQHLEHNSKFGFICQTAPSKSDASSIWRTIFLIFVIFVIFVAVVAILAAITIVVLIYCVPKRCKVLSLPEEYVLEDIKTV